MSAVEAVTRTNTSLLPHIKTWESFLQKALLLSALHLISFEWFSFRKYLEIFERLMFVDRCISEGTIIDNGQLICLYLLVTEIVKLISFFTTSFIQSKIYIFVRRASLSENWVNVSALYLPYRCKTWTNILVGTSFYKTSFPHLHCSLEWQ